MCDHYGSSLISETVLSAKKVYYAKLDHQTLYLKVTTSALTKAGSSLTWVIAALPPGRVKAKRARKTRRHWANWETLADVKVFEETPRDTGLKCLGGEAKHFFS